MAFSRVFTAQTDALRGTIVTVETDLSKGLHTFSIVGLPDKAVDESKDRVGSALKNSGFTSPKHTNQKIVVSLSPADLKKEGPFFDVAIALGYLLSSGQIAFDATNKLFLGELGLNGDVRPIRGTLALAEEAKKHGIKYLYVPKDNAREAALIRGITVYSVETFTDLVHHLDETLAKKLPDIATGNELIPTPETEIVFTVPETTTDFADIKGQESAKRGLLIAAAGGHNIAMYGPPGTGKTMLARAFAGILPDPSINEVIELTTIHSIAGVVRGELVTKPPFRAPHHTASYVSVIGGGATPKPGEVTLAHRGVLFLDEFPEFDKRVIESLRQPLEDNVVSIARAKGTALFPSNFILVVAMNPCPCGNAGSKTKPCTCMPGDIARYKRKLSGPIIDRIDIWLHVNAVDLEKLGAETTGETSEKLREKVIAARTRQAERFTILSDVRTNSDMRAKDIERYIALDEGPKKILRESAERLGISARAYHRLIKLARTIADLDGSERITKVHILEALQYRPKNI